MNRGASHGLHSAGSFGVADDVAMRPHATLMHYASDIGKCLSHQISRYGSRMSEPHERLKAAREKAGYKSTSDGARAVGVPIASYTMHESGRRGIPKDRAPIYARRFHTTTDWLLYGKGAAPSRSPLPTEDELASMLSEARDEIDARTPYGDWPRAVASSLRAQLGRFLESGLNPADESQMPATAPGKAARSRTATKPDAQAE